VPISFNPQTREFTALLAEEGTGRGSTSQLSSSTFDALLMKIRERCLVVPVEAYRVSVHEYTDDDDLMVQVTPCTVIEYHPRRVYPYIVKVAEPWAQHPRRKDSPIAYVPRVRAVEYAYLPQPEHIEAVRTAVRAIRETEKRHREEERDIKDALAFAMDAIPRLQPSDLKHVQETGKQAAVPPHEIGALVYDLTEETDES
jgi:hypothetical protein